MTCDRSLVTATETNLAETEIIFTETDTRRWSQGLLVLRPILQSISGGCDRSQSIAIETINEGSDEFNTATDRAIDRS